MDIMETAPKLPHETTCQYCGMTHKGTCPRIRAIEYHDNGTIKRIEFRSPFEGFGSGE